jgi:hypothetical protein
VNEWIVGLAGFRGRTQWSGDGAGLCRLEGMASGDRAGLKGGSLEEHGPVRAEEEGQRTEIPWPAEQRLCSLWGGLGMQHQLFF